MARESAVGATAVAACTVSSPRRRAPSAAAQGTAPAAMARAPLDPRPMVPLRVPVQTSGASGRGCSAVSKRTSTKVPSVRLSEVGRWEKRS
jgi:hypothetical protein